MEHTKVLIVGAGMSGLSACLKLIEAGIYDFKLIEASDRIGGRIHTIFFDNSFIEMGAQWIHGTKKNPIFELSKSLDLLDGRKITEGSVHYRSQDGTQLDEGFVEKIFDKIENIFDNLEDLIENELEEDSDENMDDGFIKILKKLKTNENVNIETIKSIYRSRCNEEKVDNACEDLRRLSAIGWNEHEYFDGEQFTRLKYGYSKLIEYFFAQIPTKNILFNHLVANIDWSESPLRVTCVDQSNKQNITFTSDFVVSTCSTGYLKNHHHKLFSPDLPLEKIKAIENLGFGLVDKLFVCFDKPLFNKNYEGMKILWQDDITFYLDCDKKWNLQENKFYQALDNFEVLPNLPNVLVCFLVGKEALFIENLEEECLIDVINELFVKCFFDLKLPKPKRVLRSRWNEDKFALGSYTYIKIGSGLKDVKELHRPLNNSLFFSGEATNYKYMGTVHGAYITGREVANRIIRLAKF
ncbi:spermine oxidase-like [Brachionus plicatilis]|uniref:Spermine oxidase-like n=1 Tax=Brachionus plicatilis TaxID=10195 RepID=A0A3M7PL36_BRAPC|nr:spermine oxidase-like [Brachionus plicatilis]